MEGKNVEENKARDKWCSLCVSCGERPRLINRRIDTRYIRRKERKRERERGKRRGKTKDGRLSPALQKKKRKKKRDCKSFHNDARSIVRHARTRACARVCDKFPVTVSVFLIFSFSPLFIPVSATRAAGFANF